jgi:lipopolysaccharide export LptBFGC system permease protein LptF
LFYLNYIYQIINPILTRKPDLIIVIKLLLFLLPSIISLALPTTFLISVLLTFSTLNETKELTILQTMGIKSFFYTKNIVFLSVLFSIILTYFNIHTVPQSYKSFKKIYLSSILSKPYIKFSENSVLTLDNKNFFVQKVKDDKLLNVFIQNTLGENLIQTTYAKSAKVHTDINDNIIFELQDGRITIVDKTNPAELTHLRFEKYIFIIYNKQMKTLITQTKTLREMTNKELLDEFENSKSKKYKCLILSEYFLRYSLSTSIIIFAILGIAISLRIKKHAKPLSFVFTAIIILIYYFSLSASLSIIDRMELKPYFSLIGTIMQLPNIILFLIYLFLAFV